MIDIYGNVDRTRPGAASRDKIRAILAKQQQGAAARIALVVRGQMQTMRSSFIGLVGGLLFSILLVYLLIVVNFQSWLDPFIIISALPAALAGIVWLLFLTGHAHQRAGADRLHHVHGRGHGEQHPGGQLCQGAAGDQ